MAMLQEIEIDSQETRPELETDALPQAKAATLTGAFVQRGRDRAPRLQESSLSEARPSDDTAPAAATAPPLKLPPPPASRWSDALFLVACCAAFFATFLFVLHF